MIEAQRLRKAFGTRVAVSDVTLRASDGCITGLLGANGAGKSTTLRMLCTVLRPDSGDALIDGHSVLHSPLAAARQIGVLVHGAGIYPNLTARENILYFAALHGLAEADARRRAAELVGMLEMEDFADRRARGFSQGERVRTALARALVHGPRNLLLDEPTNGLDVMAVRALRNLLRALRDAGHCVLLSSHVMQEVAALCDQVVVIADGAVRASGSPQEIRARTGAAELEEAFVELVGAGAAADGPAGSVAAEPPAGT
ncbi:MAG: ATP-binding cassette domain-containing protein [Proteobacteria bacterium]|nr:ATP-binding cassette domain-containing protein [Pseudomonadota bacterium]